MILNDRERQKIFISFYASDENKQKQFFGKWYLYAGKKYIIGRRDSDINIRHPLISKQHLEIVFYTQNLIKIKDLFSRNGTYINNSKVAPNQEIKFTTKDKLSLGDINNTIVFLENDGNKKSIFQSKINDENERNASEETQKIVHTEPQRNLTYNANRQMNLRNNYQNRRNRQNQPYFRYRFNPRQRFMPNNLNDNYRTFDNQRRRFQNYNNYNQNQYIRRNYDDYLKREIGNAMNNNNFIGKKQERNESNDYQRRHLQQLIESKKRGIEILKQKLKNIGGEEDFSKEKRNESTEDKNNRKIINIREDEDVEKIILKPKNLKDLEFVMPAKERDEKEGGKKIKYLVDGYMVLDVKNKNLTFE